MLNIRHAEPSDHNEIWEIFHEIVSHGETYPFAPETERDEALKIWIEIPTATYVAELDLKIVGTYYIKPNQPGLGSHVCNCGYMVSAKARGQGVATTMCKHSQIEAQRMGFLAMQLLRNKH